MAAPKTVKTYPLDGSTKDFEIPFEYLTRKFVVVTLIGANRSQLVLNTDYRFTQRTIITTTVAWGPSDGYDLIEIKRVTSATDRLVDFSDGSILKASELNTANVQSLHIAEEGRDIATDTIGVDNNGNLDARGRKIVNVADAVDAGDAVPLRMLQNFDNSALNSANRAKASEDAAKVSENKAKTSETNAKASETSAAASAQTAIDEVAKIDDQLDQATASANLAKDWAGKLGSQVVPDPDPSNNLSSRTYAVLSQQASSSATASKDAAKVSETNAKASEVAAKNSENIATTAGVQMGMGMWGWRPQPFKGFVVDDGQELDRSVFTDFAAMLDAGLLPTVTESQWQADPTLRGCFVAVSSTGKFRMRDLNGVQPGSIQGLFRRGGSAANPVIRADQMQGHHHGFKEGSGSDGNAALFGLNLFQQNGAAGIITDPISDGVNGTPRTGNETAPKQVTGAWMTRLFGIITPLGSTEAASLATAYASVAARVSALEAQQPLGWGQSYKDVTSTRAIGGTYTNNTNRPILVCVTVTAGTTTANVPTARIQVTQDSLTVVVGYIQATESNGSQYQGFKGFGSFVVPAGASYKVDASVGAVVLQSWTELRQ